MQSSRKDTDGTDKSQVKPRVKTGMTVQGIPAFKKEPPLKEERREDAAAPQPEEKRENHVQKDNYFVYDQELGRGGMGVVYRARHVFFVKGKKIERPVAIKEIKFADSEISSDPDLLEQKKDELQKRFLTEVETVSKLKHKNIVDIRWFGETEEGRPFYVMEYLEGTDLDQHIFKKKTLKWEEIKPIVSQICAALIVAHEYQEEEGEGDERQIISKPIIHRDMKPANVFLVFDETDKVERVVVLDFGLAKILVQRNPEDTFKGNAIDGTAEYMSPEQSFGLDVDHRSDIYSAGVMLYEMVSGHPPFAPDFRIGRDFQFELRPKRVGGEWKEDDYLSPEDFVKVEDWETFRNSRFYEFRDKRMEESPPALEHIPESLQRVIFRCLERKPEGRYQSMRELKADIDKLNGLASWEGDIPKSRKPPEEDMNLPSVMVRQSMLSLGQRPPAPAEIDPEQTMVTAPPVPPGESPWASYAQPDSVNPQDLPSSLAPQSEDAPVDQRGIKTQVVRVRDPSRNKPTETIPNKAAMAKRSKRLTWAALGIAGAVAIGGGTAAYVASRDAKEPVVADVEPVPEPPQLDSTVRVIPPQPTAPDAGVAQAQTFAITFRTTPSGTELVHGSETFTCRPECRLTVSNGTEPLEFLFRKTGYRDRTERVVPDQDRAVRVRLERRTPPGGSGGTQGSGTPPIIIRDPN